MGIDPAVRQARWARRRSGTRTPVHLARRFGRIAAVRTTSRTTVDHSRTIPALWGLVGPRARSPARTQKPPPERVSRKPGYSRVCASLGTPKPGWERARRRSAGRSDQAGAAPARQSLSRLWVVAMSFHSAWQA